MKNNEIKGIASYQIPDTYGNIIDISSMSLKEVRRETGNFWFCHNKNLVIGNIRKVWKAGEVLRFEAAFNTDDFSRCIKYFVDKKILIAFSIGLIYSKKHKKGIYVYHSALKEISSSPIGANGLALVEGAPLNDFDLEKGRTKMIEFCDENKVQRTEKDDEIKLLIQWWKYLLTLTEERQEKKLEEISEALKYALFSLTNYKKEEVIL